jgi:hypothetical protein
MTIPGNSLEKDVQRVYSYLLNVRDEGVVVANRVFMTGKSGVQHEIDVYYEFSRAGIRHRVGFECKDWAAKVSKGQVQEFESKLRDIGNITGVMVTRNGYQSGAAEFARHHDILPMLFSELPSFSFLMGKRLDAVALPHEDYVGEPFWIIMEADKGKVTGSHYGTKDPRTGKGLIPLMFSRAHADRLFREARLDGKQWAVRGLPRFAFRAFLLTLEIYEKRMNTSAVILFLPPMENAEFIGIPASREYLIREYYGEPLSCIEDEVDFKNSIKPGSC